MTHRYRLANLNNEKDSQMVGALVAGFEASQKRTIAQETQGLMEKLKDFPTTRAYVCEVDRGGFQAAGLALCFLGFSTFLQKPLLNLHDFFMIPEFQGQGLGRGFLAFLEKESRREGWGRVTLEAYQDNSRAVALYESCGFKGSGNQGERVCYFYKKDVADKSTDCL